MRLIIDIILHLLHLLSHSKQSWGFKGVLGIFFSFTVCRTRFSWCDLFKSVKPGDSYLHRHRELGLVL